MISKIFGNSIKDSFKSFDISLINESRLIGCSASNNGYEKIWMLSQKRNLLRQRE